MKNRRFSRLAVMLIAAALLSSCSDGSDSVSGVSSESVTLSAGDISEAAEEEGVSLFNTDEYTYDIISGDNDNYIAITGLRNEYQVDYTVPDDIDGIPVRVLGEYSFCYSQIQTLDIGKGVKTIAEGAFYDCSALTSLVLPDNVTEIGDYAFYHNTLLAGVTIPSTVTSIGGLAFWDTPWLASLTDEYCVFGDGVLLDYNGAGGDIALPSGVKSVSSAFYFNENVTSVVVKSGCAEVGAAAFMCCSSLKSVSLEQGVTSIGASAFRDCEALTELHIPSTVQSIGVSAFDGCPNLTIYAPEGSPAAVRAEYDGIAFVAEP